MSHGLPLAPGAAKPAEVAGPLRPLLAAMAGVNRAVEALGGLALVAAALVLSYSVVVRYLLKVPTEWQDETAVFLLVGATFLSAAGVQARRGHIGIEAVAAILPPAVNVVRGLLTDVASALFCAFFAWKSWTLLEEAWVDDQHSSSTWGPPLWIPYGLMALGMTLLTLQIVLQVAAGVARRTSAR